MAPARGSQSKGKPGKQPAKGPGKVAHKQKPSFKSKNRPKPQANKPNKPEIRRNKRNEKIAKEKAEQEKVRAERDARIKAYKKQRLEKTKAISKKTQRGQPLMKDRMQLLLKQIEEMKRR
ncbi:hypothetical protein KR032_000183 [Drosophila birchii]|nr:hypothetical protein KR032_000183 [Drosophila birchii]